MRKRGEVSRILGRFGRGELDVLVGTQMIAKGHDFAGVTLVGVVSADMGLGLADFRAAERTFQLLTQVAGRAGRGERPGAAIIQTINPGHYSIRLACRQDYAGFYAEERRYRQAMHYPPAVAIVNVVIRGESLADAMGAAADLASRIPRSAGIGVLGPAPAPLARLRGEYRAQVFLKSRHRRRDARRASVRPGVAARARAARDGGRGSGRDALAGPGSAPVHRALHLCTKHCICTKHGSTQRLSTQHGQVQVLVLQKVERLNRCGREAQDEHDQREERQPLCAPGRAARPRRARADASRPRCRASR